MCRSARHVKLYLPVRSHVHVACCSVPFNMVHVGARVMVMSEYCAWASIQMDSE